MRVVYFLSLMQKSSQDELKQQLAKVFEEKHKSELASKVNYSACTSTCTCSQLWIVHLESKHAVNYPVQLQCCY